MRKPSGLKPVEYPAPRRHDWETVIRQAFRDRVCIHYRCEGDTRERTMEPYILYFSGNDKVLVGGWQTENPNKPSKPDWRNPEVGALRSLSIGGAAFRPDPAFNDRDERYKRVIASISRPLVSNTVSEVGGRRIRVKLLRVLKRVQRPNQPTFNLTGARTDRDQH